MARHFVSAEEKELASRIFSKVILTQGAKASDLAKSAIADAQAFFDAVRDHDHKLRSIPINGEEEILLREREVHFNTVARAFAGRVNIDEASARRILFEEQRRLLNQHETQGSGE